MNMKTFTERDFITYPRQFKAYKWYKPILAGLLFIVFLFFTNMLVEYITRTVFHTAITDSGYDSMDLFTAAGAFRNCALNACYIPSLILSALVVKDRPVSSYFSSMGGWRWKIFFKALAAGFVIAGIPLMIYNYLSGWTGEIRFTAGGAIMLAVFLPLMCIAEEMLYRSYIMQTAGSWLKISVIGLVAQILAFTIAHPYNTIGRIDIAFSALMYGLVCVFSRGIEASSALHLVNNGIGMLMVGIGFGYITSEVTVFSAVFNIVLKLLLLLFIIYADRKLHWFDEVKKDDITKFNSNQ